MLMDSNLRNASFAFIQVALGHEFFQKRITEFHLPTKLCTLYLWCGGRTILYIYFVTQSGMLVLTSIKKMTLPVVDDAIQRCVGTLLIIEEFSE